jgi:hypothetical protein
LVHLEGSRKSDDNLGSGAVDLATSDLDDLTDGNRLVTPDIQDSFQDEVGVQSGGSKGRCIASLERQGEEDSGVERPVVVGIARQDEPMGQGFGINRGQIGHAHRVRRFVGCSKRLARNGIRF